MEKDKGLFSFRKHPVANFLDGKKGRKRKGGRLRLSMGFLLAAALIFNTLPASGLAVSASGREARLCEHHTEHTADCGYIPKSEDGEGSPCTYECRICPIEDLITALPEQVTEDNAADGRTDQQVGDEASVTIGGETLYYATLEEAFDAANGKTATITMLTDAECIKDSAPNGSPLNITGGTVTLDMKGNTLSGKGYGYYGIINVGGGSLSVRGQGTVTVFHIGLTCNRGTLAVDGIIFNLTGDGRYEAEYGVANKGGFVTLNNVKMSGASTGQVCHYSGDTTINNVTTTDSQGAQSGPTYCGVYYQGESGTLTINGGTFDKIVVESDNYGGVQSVADLLGEGCAYKKQDGTWATADEMAAMEISNVTVEEIPLTIDPQGDTSWYYSTQQTHTLTMNAAPVDSVNSVTYVWKNGDTDLNCPEDTYTVPAGMSVGSYTYTCEATCDGYTLSHTFTFKIEQSGTEFTGGIKTYNGSEETTSFSADDTITVKAAPTAAGTAPQKAAARLRSDPTAGQMALFVGDVQVSEPVEAGADGIYTMTVSAAEVLLQGNAEPNGNAITLTAKFVGNDNMADAAGTVDVRISAVAMAEKDGTVIGYFGVSNFEGTNNLFCQNAYANATITLLGDVQPGTNSDMGETCSTMVNITCTLDLAGHKFTSTDIAIYVLPMGNLTIQDSSTGKTGQIISNNAAAVVRDGVTTLKGGNYTGTPAIKVTSGTLSGILPAAGDTCCAFYQNGKPILLTEWQNKAELAGSVTVQECRHTGVEVKDFGDGKHGLDCPYCGYHSEHTTALTATASENNVTLNGGCGTEDCGYQTILGTASFTFPKVTYGQSGDVMCTWDGPAGYYVLIEVIGGSQSQFDKNEDENIAERSWTLAQLFGSTKVTAGGHKLKVSFFSDAAVQSNACELDFTIAPAPLMPSITGTATKTYDGTTDCDGTGLSIELGGVVDGDTVTATASYAYDNANVGENKTITASGITLVGGSKDNYTLSSTTATTTGTITKSRPAIVFASGYNPGKTYDGQAIPDPTADNLTITGADFSDVTFAWSATPKDAGTYTLTAAIPETTNTEAASDTLTVTISPRIVTPAITITPSSYEYTGSAICPSGSAVKVMDGNTVIPDSEYTLSYGENTQVGNGSVTVTDKENGNYTIARTTETFTITKANQATLTITGAPGSVTYGDTFQLGFSGGSGSGAPSWAASGATVDNAGNVTITRAGTVIITAAKAGDSNYSGTEAQIMLNVSKKALTVSGVDAQDRAYDGTNKAAITAVTLSGIVPGDAGKVEVDLNGIQGTLSGVNAGTYTSVTLPQLTLTGEGSGNYTLLQPEAAVPASVKITPLDAVITIGTDTYHKTFGDAAFTLDVTDNNTEADVQYEVTKGTDVVAVENGTVTIRNAGTAAITVSLPATANYNAAENKTITITVDKKSGYTAAALNRNYYYQDGGTDSIDLGLLLPKDCGNAAYGEPAVSGNVAYSAAPAVSGGKLSYTLDSGNVNEEGTITVTVTTRNFEDITVTVNVKLTDQIPVSLKTGTEVTLKNSVLTYGEPLSDLAFNEAEFVGTDGKTVAGTLAWKEAAATPDAGTVGAVWVFTPTENKYVSLEGMAAITVNKAVPTVPAAPTVPDRVYNPQTTLKDIDVSGGTVTGVDGKELKGGWSWQSADIVPAVKNSGYAAVFTPEDTANYEAVTRTITVNVAKATPYIAKSPAAAGITYGETLKDSALSGGTVQYGNGAGQAGDGAGSAAAVAGTFTWKEPSTKPVAADSSVTEYTVVFTPSDTANYNPVETKATLTVNKAQNAPNMPGSTMDVPNSLEKAGDVPLPEGWEWQVSDRDTALEVGKPVSAAAVYAGADKGNYEKETVTVAVTRSARPGDDTTKPGDDTTKPGDNTTKPGDDTTKPADGTAKPGDGTAKSGTGRPGDAEPGGGSTEETRPDTGIPFIKGEDGKNGWDVIRAEEEKAEEGSIINVDMNGTTVVPGDIFDSIKGKDITITFDMGSGILWSVDGKSITTDKVGDIDFSVKTETNAIPVDIVNNVTGERYSIQISLAHEGEFGFTAVLSIGLGRENAGFTASLYYYNTSTGELEFICSGDVAEDGTVSPAFTHASDYVIAIDAEEENGSTAEPAQPENQDEDDSGKAENPQTAQAWRTWWFIVAGALVLITGIGAFFMVKKKREDEGSGRSA